MHPITEPGLVVASLSKHKIAGIVGIALGVILVVFGGFRVASRVAGAFIIPVVGVVVVILGVLLVTRAI